VETKDILKIILFVILVPVVYYIKKSDKSDHSRDTGSRSKNLFTGIAISLILSLSLLFILKYVSLGPKSVLIIPVLGIASCVVVIYYISKR
jgi:hypothetical protein